MAPSSPWTRPEAIVRGVFATATIVFLGLALVIRDGRLFIAGGICGVLWTVWDVLWGKWIAPGGAWGFRALTEGPADAAVNVRPTLDDTIRLLESHLVRDASPSVHLQAALRLEEIYRTIRRDPDRARAVLERALTRYPDAPELRARLEALDDRGDRDGH